MRFFRQAARRAAVLLLCLSMLTGMLIPAFAATTDPATETPAHNLVYTDNQGKNHDPIYKVWLTDDGVSGGCGDTEDGYVVDLIYAGATPEFRFGTEKPTEPVVLTVFERYEGESAVVAKTYTLSELKALAQTEVVGYQHWKNGSEKVIASNLYATVGSLLADAGVEFGAGDAVTAADPTDFTSTLTYEDSDVYKYYVNEDGATEVPAAILLSWSTGSGTPEDIAKTAYISGSLRFAYGITEQQYADQSAQGKRLAANIATITVVHGTKAEEPWVNPFRDVTESDWFYDDVRFANQNGLFNGVEKDLFAPEESMTRGMLVTVLWRLDGETAPKTATTFTDVDANAYYADAVAWAAESGVVNGIGGNKFDPEGNVTREQIAAILFRYAAFKGVDTAARANLATFPDAEKTSAYAHDALSWAVAAELVKGTKEGSTIYLDPQGSATRAQVAAILSRYAQNIVK